MLVDDKSIPDDNNISAGSIIKNLSVCPICKSSSVISDPESGEERRGEESVVNVAS
jgi:hypothetical protein